MYFGSKCLTAFKQRMELTNKYLIEHVRQLKARLLENSSVVSLIVPSFPWYLILASFVKDHSIIS